MEKKEKAFVSLSLWERVGVRAYWSIYPH